MLLIFIVTVWERGGGVLQRWRRWRKTGKLAQIVSKYMKRGKMIKYEVDTNTC